MIARAIKAPIAPYGAAAKTSKGLTAFLNWMSLAIVPLSIYVLHLHSLPELCLAHVIGNMRRSAE